MVAAPPRIPRRAVSTARARHQPSGRRRGVWFVALFILIVGLMGVVFLSPLLAVRGVTIFGTEGELLDAVRAHVIERVSGTNMLLFDSEALRISLEEAVPQVEVVSAVRVWPRDIRVELSERTSLGTWCRSSDVGRPCYYFDRSGAVWGEAIPSSGTLLLTVIDERPEGDLQAKLLEELLVLTDGVRALDVAVRQVTVQGGPLEVVAIESTEGYELRFSRMNSLREQLEVFGAFLADRRTTETVPGQYMDMTVPGKVYFQ